MGKYDKLKLQILSGTADANVPFEELCRLLQKMGFEERTRGSHHTFRKADVVEKINLQRDGSKAKVYQVRQVRAVLLKYKLGSDDL
jgi:predicted RNA binding protein YcfA (HicA-like mRNA interferase family)